jgi:GMP synthase (glutamine-hydrolysing)
MFDHELAGAEIVEAQSELAHVNETWRNPERKVFVASENQELSYKECYDRDITLSREIFDEVSQVADMEIPPQKYLLFVDMAHPGAMGSEKTKLIDPDRLAKAYEAETGSPEVTQDFQSANMRYVFGFKPNDTRFVTVKPFQEEMPLDLSDCVGVILSGSEANIKDELMPERIAMTNKVMQFIHKAKELNIPMFGICFGSQLLNSVFRAKIDWIRDIDNNNVTEETGLVLLHKTETGSLPGSPLEKLPSQFYVHANHKQEVLKDSMPEDLEILASSDTSQVQIVKLKNSDVVWAIQNHIECGDARADVISDMFEETKKDEMLFQGESSKARRVICPHFLRTAGKFARTVS